MTKLLVFVAIVFYSVTLSAQDTLYKTDGSRQLVTIIEITQSQVRYKPYSNPDSPPFAILGKYITQIVNADGQITTFEGSRSVADSVRILNSVQLVKAGAGRNIISLNVTDVLIGMISANYEHILPSGKLGLKIPLSVGFNTIAGNRYDYSYYKYSPRTTIIGSGIDLDFYPGGQRQVSYFVGPSLQLRLFNADYTYYDPVSFVYSSQGIPLSVYIETENGWQFVDYFNSVGPLASRDLVMPVDVSKVKGDKVKLRLQCGFMFWEVDYAAMDFSDNIAVQVSRIAPENAMDENGKDVTSLLASTDKKYLVQPEAGNEVVVSYRSKASIPGYMESAFLHSRGYYEYIREYKNKPDIAYLKSFREGGAFTRFSKEKYLKFVSDQKLISKALADGRN